MPRVKISEFKAKELISSLTQSAYGGLQITDSDYSDKIDALDETKTYVVKVDQGVKKRNKLGLVYVQIHKNEIKQKIQEFKEKGYTQYLVEEFIPHDPKDEKFIALERTREGVKCHYTNLGGVNVEEAKDSIKSVILSINTIPEVSKELELDTKYFASLVAAFDKLYLSFLESNPFLAVNGGAILLDLAIEVDSAADFFVNGLWTKSDFVESNKETEPEEIEIKKLADSSSASFKFVVLNPEGSIFTIFSGGGASIVLADEINNVGRGNELADYAEYSGGPTEEETYIFTKNILSLALRSSAKNKKLYIAGGVANFTDIRATFKGVIRALDDNKDELKSQGIKVYVRRGGPYQEEGLKLMRNFLDNAGLLGEVMGPDRVLTEVITSNN